MKVIKRDGREVEFDKKYIITAISKAIADVKRDTKDLGIVNQSDLDFSDKIASKVENQLVSNNLKEVHIEKIQDMVEEALTKSTRKDVAISYIRYRQLRAEERFQANELDNEIQGLFDMTSEEVRNNANKDGSKIQSYRAMISDITCKNYAKRRIIPERFLKEHEKTIYIHDLNYIAVPFFNCMLINWIDMLDNGCNINGTDIESPKSIQTAIALLSQIVAHVSSNCYGGVTLPRLTHLSKYGKLSLDKHRKIAEEESIPNKEGYAWRRLEKEIYDAAQGFEYEIQTLTNSRAEVPFLTAELDLGNENATKEEKKIERLIIEAFLKVRLKGLTGDVTATFPKIVFTLKKGVNLNPTDPNYDLFQLAIKCSSKRLYPDYLMYDKIVEVTGGYKPPMSCRSFLGEWFDENGERKILGRFNQGVCSINLVRLAIQSNGDEKKFYELLDKALNLTKDILMFRHNLLKGLKAKQAPILYMSGAVARLNPEDTIDNLLVGGYSSISIGYVGVHNAMMALYGESFYDSDIMQEKAKEIIQYMKDFTNKAKEETNIGFSLYSTPAEVLATKFCKQDIKDFGVIKGVNDLGYYENSFHYPSFKMVNPFDKIDIESNYSKIASGGAIQYVEFGNMIHNTEALEEIIRYAYNKCHYFGVNVSSDRCFKCGYVGEILSINETQNDYECPQCGNKDKSTMNVIRRLCGYLGSLTERPSVDNKMKEIHKRIKHVKGE